MRVVKTDAAETPEPTPKDPWTREDVLNVIEEASQIAGGMFLTGLAAVYVLKTASKIAINYAPKN